MTEPLPPLVAPWRIGVDVGGTFTDMVLRDSAGAVRIYKAPSVPADPSEGVLGVLRLAAQQLDLPLTALLRDCALFVHGSTVATNTILEKKGAKVGMLTTEGFRDSLEIRRGIRDNQWDHRAPFPPVLAPRYLRLPVRGRIGADGKELAPLAAEDVDAAARVFADEGVESVAVCLFNSFLDGTHEHAVGAQLAKSWAGKWISLSSEVMPTMGEYERGSTAVVNAYIAPKVTSYLSALDAQLRQLGLPHSLLLLQSNGGAVSVAQVANRPVMLVLSGPAAGVGALKGCAAPGEAANLISMEIGGTSCDVMVMARGQVPVADELMIDGYHLTTPSVEIHTVGAGGGAIAWVDDAGLLHVGPQGAGARPGPAAYGLGGEQPTVTDAQLVLGRLRPGPLAGGAVTLDGALARKAVEDKLARPLGLSVEDAAAGVIRLLEQNLLHAVERLSIERGHNPATFTLVAAGGAGPMHGTAVARALGCSRALLPRAAGAFCALGMLQSDVRQDYLQVFLADLDKVDQPALDAGFGQLEIARPRRARPRRVWRHRRDRARNGPALRRPAMAGPGRPQRQRLRRRRRPPGLRSGASAPVRPHPARRPHRHHRASRRRPRPPRLDAAGRALAAGRAAQAAREAQGLDRSGARLARRADLRRRRSAAGLQARRSAADRGTHHDRLRRPARPARGRCARRLSDSCWSRLMSPTLDPVTLALVQNRLDHISHQMGWVMTRTARSPIFSQSHDFSCFIADARGTLISQADGIPIHTGGGGFAVRAILRDFKDAIQPEDVFLLNDPYTAGGNHLPDWVIARPVFVAGALVAFACNRAHQADIGGGAAGTYNSAATEIFHEGIRLPVLKLIEGGRTRDDLWRLLLINTRLPDALDGDLRAMIGSTRIGAERLALLVEELGAGRAGDFFEGVLDHADRRFRTCIDRLAEGVWRAEETVDNDCFEPIDGRIAVTLTVKDRRLIVDFAGTSPQIRGFKNSSIANSTSAVFMALASFFEPDLPKNEGAFRSVEIRLPEGTLVNARAPAPMTMNTVFVAHEIVHVVWKALGQALPERASAGWSKAVHAVTAGLRADGGRYVMYQWAGAPAGGGVEGRDGFHLIGHLITLGGLTLPNLETYEHLYPVRFRRQELRCDSAGPGRFRGGAGCDYEVEIFTPADYAFRGEGVGAPSSFGAAGGRAGSGGEVVLTLADGKRIQAPKYGVERHGPGTYRALSPGGGGYGDPRTRDPARVLRDVRDGVVSRARRRARLRRGDRRRRPEHRRGAHRRSSGR